MLAAAAWIAPAATMIAAMMTAANLGARVTGWGFVVFAAGAIFWVTLGLARGEQDLVLSNSFLLLVDLVGVWRWLGRRARYDEGARAAIEESAASPTPTLFALGSLEGRPVHDRAGDRIAVAVDGMAACDSGRIAYLVVSAGGVGGVGEHLHALGWHEVRVTPDGITTEIDAARLRRRPALATDHWPESAEAAGVG